jgi:hypothetical protein
MCYFTYVHTTNSSTIWWHVGVYWLSAAMDMAESLLGRGLNPPARRRCCAVAASALRAHSPPSTAPIRASALPIRLLADAPSRLLVPPGDVGLLWWARPPPGALRSLWRLQRNEPGWFVGEHMQLRRLRAPPAGDEDETLTGGPADRASVTRVGEAER